MNWDRVKGKWKQLAGSLQATWGGLTGDEAAEISGNLARLEGKLQERYARTRPAAKTVVDDRIAEA